MNTCPFENINQECSSGCESGWTLYLEHDSSITSPYSSCNRENDCRDGRRNRGFTQVKRLKREEEEELEEEEDKDSSMVSDASSGPPHFHELEDGYNNGTDQNGCFYHYSTLDASLSRNNYLNRQKTKENQRRRRKVNEDPSSNLLDDTASSPFLDFSSKSFGNTSSSCQPSMENHVLEYSQGYSTTQFEAETSLSRAM